MAQHPLFFEWQEAKDRAAQAAADYAAAIDAGRLYSSHEISSLKQQRDDADAKLRELVDALKQI